jgi:hypothetical protein
MATLWPDFLAVVDSEVAARGIGTVHVKSPFSTLGGALGLVFPWSLVLLAALIRAVYRAKSGLDRKGLWLAAWFFGCVIPFFFIRSFARYMTPLIPAAALLCAHWLEQGRGPLRSTLVKISMSLMALVAVVFCLFFMWFGLGVPMAALCLAATGVMLWLTFSDKDVRLAAASVAVLFCLIMGGLYPSLRVNALPEDLVALIGSRPVAAFNSSQPSMLSIRLGRSAVQIRSFVEEERQELRGLDGFVFVREPDADAFEALADQLGVDAALAGRFKTFYSRQAWIRFAREDATASDWKAAAASRSLESLKPAIRYYRVRPGDA